MRQMPIWVAGVQTITTAGSALILLLSSCQPAPEPQVVKPGAPSASLASEDVRLLKVAEQLPGFGGMFVDPAGKLGIYIVEDVGELSDQELANRRESAKKAIKVYDDGLARREIRIVEAQFTIPQLMQWRGDIDQQVALPELLFSDVDEVRNRVVIGVENDLAGRRIERSLDGMGIPREAVLFEITKPSRFQATLRDRVRPVPGGVHVEADVGVFALKECTMGFNAIRFGVSGFVTNSHCTETQGGSEGTDFHQPDDPVFSEGNKVGDEIVDPPYFTGEPCPPGRRCRYSDSAFVAYSIPRGTGIARTTGVNTGSVMIDGINQRLSIVAEGGSWATGDQLDKVGRATGWTSGVVMGTCLTIPVKDTDITLLCQKRVGQLPGQTQPLTANGDSGAPMFQRLRSTVVLAGINWGGADDGSHSNFSSIDLIEMELGPLTTFFPGPSPQMCPRDHKCCGVVRPGGACDGECVPADAQCQ
jgi:hypothetical protein